MVIANPQFLTGRVNALARVKLSRKATQIDITHERTEQDDAVAVFDIAAHLFASHRSLINTQIKWMTFADDGLAQQRCTDRDVVMLRKLQ